MTWTATKSRDRIRKDLQKIPSVDVSSLEVWNRQRKSLLEKRGLFSAKISDSLVDIPRGKAVIADTVQAYANVINLESIRKISGQESSESHKRVLTFFHLYYTAIDRIIDGTSLQRVDFHGGRVHLVVLAENREKVTGNDVARAYALLDEIKVIASEIGRSVLPSHLQPSIRCGIDVGTCAAINNGTKAEPEPLFVGSSANYAAKLAEGDAPGIYVSQNASLLLNMPTKKDEYSPYYGYDTASSLALVEQGQNILAKQQSRPQDMSRRSVVNEAVEFAKGMLENSGRSSPSLIIPNFQFFYKSPPMSKLDFEELMPSHSLRMNVATIFADICGYTRFVDQCIASGRAATAIRALYIIRNELREVLEKDFNGRKLRFIGDCIHGFTAEGLDSEIDGNKSVRSAIEIAAAMHSSLRICKEELGDIHQLEISVGIEFGITPISRIGIRGERSVRIAHSQSTIDAEIAESRCSPGDISLGKTARRYIPLGAQDFIEEGSGIGALPGYEIASAAMGRSLEDIAMPEVVIHVPRAHTSTANPSRAHLKLK